MKETESLTQFYESKFGWTPKGFDEQLAHFNVFDITPLHSEDEEQEVPYRRRDFFKITLMATRGSVLHYADKTVDLDGYVMIFSNPLIPYSWEGLTQIQAGKYCIFNQTFFHRFGQLSDYPVFQSGGIHVFPLTREEYIDAQRVFTRIQEEKLSTYAFKDDVVRGLIFDLMHFAMKMRPDISRDRPSGNAAERIVHIFHELLDRQFPIDNEHPRVQLHTPSDFAQQLNVHVNHLNRSIKEVTGKTTGEVIAERFMQEAKKLLLKSPMSIAEISYALGFSEPTRFNAFFKRHTNIAPTHFRKQ